jgi:hypothetical protein
MAVQEIGWLFAAAASSSSARVELEVAMQLQACAGVQRGSFLAGTLLAEHERKLGLLRVQLGARVHRRLPATSGMAVRRHRRCSRHLDCALAWSSGGQRFTACRTPRERAAACRAATFYAPLLLLGVSEGAACVAQRGAARRRRRRRARRLDHQVQRIERKTCTRLGMHPHRCDLYRANAPPNDGKAPRMCGGVC